MMFPSNFSVAGMTHCMLHLLLNHVSMYSSSFLASYSGLFTPAFFTCRISTASDERWVRRPGYGASSFLLGVDTCDAVHCSKGTVFFPL